MLAVEGLDLVQGEASIAKVALFQEKDMGGRGSCWFCKIGKKHSTEKAAIPQGNPHLVRQQQARHLPTAGQPALVVQVALPPKIKMFSAMFSHNREYCFFFKKIKLSPCGSGQRCPLAEVEDDDAAARAAVVHPGHPGEALLA